MWYWIDISPPFFVMLPKQKAKDTIPEAPHEVCGCRAHVLLLSHQSHRTVSTTWELVDKIPTIKHILEILSISSNLSQLSKVEKVGTLNSPTELHVKAWFVVYLRVSLPKIYHGISIRGVHSDLNSTSTWFSTWFSTPGTELRSELRGVEKCEKYLQLDTFINLFATHSAGLLAWCI